MSDSNQKTQREFAKRNCKGKSCAEINSLMEELSISQDGYYLRALAKEWEIQRKKEITDLKKDKEIL